MPLETSSLVKPQQSLIEVLLFADNNGLAVTPAYFTVATTAFMLNRKLIQLEAYCANDFPFSPISRGVNVIPYPDFLACTFTLLREPGNGVHGGDFYKNIPLIRARRQNDLNGSAFEAFRLDPVGVSWSDSYVNCGTAFNMGDLTVMSVPFLATYLLPEQDPEPYRTVRLKHR